MPQVHIGGVGRGHALIHLPGVPFSNFTAEGAELRWQGGTYLANSVTAEGPEASAEFGRVERAGIQAFGIQRFIHLRDVKVVDSAA